MFKTHFFDPVETSLGVSCRLVLQTNKSLIVKLLQQIENMNIVDFSWTVRFSSRRYLMLIVKLRLIKLIKLIIYSPELLECDQQEEAETLCFYSSFLQFVEDEIHPTGASD